MAKSETRAILMKDGRTVEFGEKTRMKKDYGNTSEGLVFVQIDFDNGETVRVEVAPGSPVGLQALGHGLSQKLGDGGAGADNTEDAFEFVLEIAGRVSSGEWKKVSEAGTAGSAKGASELVEALSRVINQTKEVVRDMLNKLDQSDKLALRKTPKVAEAIEAIRAERGPSKADTAKAAAAVDLLAALTRGEVPDKAIVAEPEALV